MSKEQERIGRLLGKAYFAWQSKTYQAMTDQGFGDIRPSHSPVFRFLDAGGSMVRDLARQSGMTKQSMTYLVKDLEKKGYLEISPDPDDRRAKQINLTARGKRAEAALRTLSLELESRIGEEQSRVLKAQLSSIIAAMGSDSVPT